MTKIIRESGINYTFLETVSMDTKPESKSDASNIDSNVEKDVLKKRSIDSNSKSNFNFLSYSNRVLAIDSRVSYRPGNSEFGRLIMKISQITLNELTQIAGCKQAYPFSFQNDILDEDTLAC